MLTGITPHLSYIFRYQDITHPFQSKAMRPSVKHIWSVRFNSGTGVLEEKDDASIPHIVLFTSSANCSLVRDSIIHYKNGYGAYPETVEELHKGITLFINADKETKNNQKVGIRIGKVQTVEAKNWILSRNMNALIMTKMDTEKTKINTNFMVMQPVEEMFEEGSSSIIVNNDLEWQFKPHGRPPQEGYIW